MIKKKIKEHGDLVDNIIPIQKVDEIKDKKTVESKQIYAFSKDKSETKKEEKNINERNEIEKDINKNIQEKKSIESQRVINNNIITKDNQNKIKDSSFKINLNQVNSNIN